MKHHTPRRHLCVSYARELRDSLAGSPQISVSPNFQAHIPWICSLLHLSHRCTGKLLSRSHGPPSPNSSGTLVALNTLILADGDCPWTTTMRFNSCSTLACYGSLGLLCPRLELHRTLPFVTFGAFLAQRQTLGLGLCTARETHTT